MPLSPSQAAFVHTVVKQSMRKASNEGVTAGDIAAGGAVGTAGLAGGALGGFFGAHGGDIAANRLNDRAFANANWTPAQIAQVERVLAESPGTLLGRERVQRELAAQMASDNFRDIGTSAARRIRALKGAGGIAGAALGAAGLGGGAYGATRLLRGEDR